MEMLDKIYTAIRDFIQKYIDMVKKLVADLQAAVEKDDETTVTE